MPWTVKDAPAAEVVRGRGDQMLRIETARDRVVLARLLEAMALLLEEVRLALEDAPQPHPVSSEADRLAP